MPSRRRVITERLDRSFRSLTAGFRGKPDFIIAGAQKAGTTSLFNYLRESPFLHGSSAKETHYFDRNYPKGERWYRSHFSLTRDGRRFEASPSYVVFPDVLQRIGRDLPDVRIVVLLREPVSRALSHYEHNRRRDGREKRTFREAASHDRALFEKEGMPAEYSWDTAMYSYVRRSIYAPQLRKCFEVFGRERVLVLFSEKMFVDPQSTVNKVADFLGAPHHRILNGAARNVGDYEEEDPFGEELRAFFRPHNDELFDLLGIEPCW